MFMGEFFTQMSCTLHEQWSLSSLRMIPSFSGGPHFGQKWHLVVDESSCLSLHPLQPSMVLVTALNWPFWKTNSPRKCALTPTALAFLHCAYLSEAYTISNWPDLAFRVPPIEHSSVLLAPKSSVTFFSKNATPQKSPLIPINP